MVARVTLTVMVLTVLMTLSRAEAQGPPMTRPAGVVNINTASSEQLRLLPGIGPARASRILAFRALKPFRRVIELARVRGIGRKTVKKLREFLSVEGPTTLSRRPVLRR